MEFLSRYPDIVLFHDAFGDEEMNKVLAEAHKPEGTVKDRINTKTTAMSGLLTTKATAAEVVQVITQLPGGHADVHSDSVSQNSQSACTNNQTGSTLLNLKFSVVTAI